MARQRTRQAGTLTEHVDAAAAASTLGSRSQAPVRTISDWSQFVREVQEAPQVDDADAAIALATSRYTPSRLRLVATPGTTGEQHSGPPDCDQTEQEQGNFPPGGRVQQPPCHRQRFPGGNIVLMWSCRLTQTRWQEVSGQGGHHRITNH